MSCCNDFTTTFSLNPNGKIQWKFSADTDTLHMIEQSGNLILVTRDSILRGSQYSGKAAAVGYSRFFNKENDFIFSSVSGLNPTINYSGKFLGYDRGSGTVTYLFENKDLLVNYRNGAVDNLVAYGKFQDSYNDNVLLASPEERVVLGISSGVFFNDQSLSALENRTYFDNGEYIDVQNILYVTRAAAAGGSISALADANNIEQAIAVGIQATINIFPGYDGFAGNDYSVKVNGTTIWRNGSLQSTSFDLLYGQGPDKLGMQIIKVENYTDTNFGGWVLTAVAVTDESNRTRTETGGTLNIHTETTSVAYVSMVNGQHGIEVRANESPYIQTISHLFTWGYGINHMEQSSYVIADFITQDGHVKNLLGNDMQKEVLCEYTYQDPESEVSEINVYNLLKKAGVVDDLRNQYVHSPFTNTNWQQIVSATATYKSDEYTQLLVGTVGQSGLFDTGEPFGVANGVYVFFISAISDTPQPPLSVPSFPFPPYEAVQQHLRYDAVMPIEYAANSYGRTIEFFGKRASNAPFSTPFSAINGAVGQSEKILSFNKDGEWNTAIIDTMFYVDEFSYTPITLDEKSDLLETTYSLNQSEAAGLKIPDISYTRFEPSETGPGYGIFYQIGFNAVTWQIGKGHISPNGGFNSDGTPWDDDGPAGYHIHAENTWTYTRSVGMQPYICRTKPIRICGKLRWRGDEVFFTQYDERFFDNYFTHFNWLLPEYLKYTFNNSVGTLLMFDKLTAAVTYIVGNSVYLLGNYYIYGYFGEVEYRNYIQNLIDGVGFFLDGVFYPFGFYDAAHSEGYTGDTNLIKLSDWEALTNTLGGLWELPQPFDHNVPRGGLLTDTTIDYYQSPYFNLAGLGLNGMVADEEHFFRHAMHYSVSYQYPTIFQYSAPSNANLVQYEFPKIVHHDSRDVILYKDIAFWKKMYGLGAWSMVNAPFKAVAFNAIDAVNPLTATNAVDYATPNDITLGSYSGLRIRTCYMLYDYPDDTQIMRWRFNPLFDYVVDDFIDRNFYNLGFLNNDGSVTNKCYAPNVENMIVDTVDDEISIFTYGRPTTNRIRILPTTYFVESQQEKIVVLPFSGTLFMSPSGIPLQPNLVDIYGVFSGFPDLYYLQGGSGLEFLPLDGPVYESAYAWWLVPEFSQHESGTYNISLPNGKVELSTTDTRGTVQEKIRDLGYDDCMVYGGPISRIRPLLITGQFIGALETFNTPYKTNDCILPSYTHQLPVDPNEYSHTVGPLTGQYQNKAAVASPSEYFCRPVMSGFFPSSGRVTIDYMNIGYTDCVFQVHNSENTIKTESYNYAMYNLNGIQWSGLHGYPLYKDVASGNYYHYIPYNGTISDAKIKNNKIYLTGSMVNNEPCITDTMTFSEMFNATVLPKYNEEYTYDRNWQYRQPNGDVDSSGGLSNAGTTLTVHTEHVAEYRAADMSKRKREA